MYVLNHVLKWGPTYGFTVCLLSRLSHFLDIHEAVHGAIGCWVGTVTEDLFCRYVSLGGHEGFISDLTRY